MGAKKSVFQGSFAAVKQANQFSFQPEIALAGKSNVGKSSLLGALLGQKMAVKVSATPGKTRLLNYFQYAPGPCHLVDLPGFGYAKISKSEISRISAMLEDYFENSKNLRGFLYLKDCRREWDDVDLDWLELISARFDSQHWAIVYTKLDKLNQSQNQMHKRHHEEVFGTHDVGVFYTSVAKNRGLEPLQSWILQTCQPGDNQ